MTPIPSIPVQTPPVEKIGALYQFTVIWQRFLKAMADTLTDATKIGQTDEGTRFVRMGSQVFVAYEGTGLAAVRLPLPPVIVPALDVFDGSTWSKVLPTQNADGTFSVAVPALAASRVQGTYLVDVGRV